MSPYLRRTYAGKYHFSVKDVISATTCGAGPTSPRRPDIPGLRDAESSPERLQELIEKLRLIQSFAISSSNLRVRMVCEKESAGNNESILQKWISGLPNTRSPSANLTTTSFKSADKAFYDMPYKVYYSGQARQTVPFVDPSSAPLSILSQLLTHNYLHPEIRRDNVS